MRTPALTIAEAGSVKFMGHLEDSWCCQLSGHGTLRFLRFPSAPFDVSQDQIVDEQIGTAYPDWNGKSERVIGAY